MENENTSQNKPDQQKPEPQYSNRHFVKDLIIFAVLAVVIVIPIRIFIAQPFIVSGESMVPTFESGEYLIVDQLSYRLHSPERGDVIIFKYPNNPSRYFIKRVIGLPGETVEIVNDVVHITSGDTKIILDEPYITLQRDSNMTMALADDEYFVMGDNRLASLDSREWGPLQEDFITGRALVRLLPFERIDLLPGKYNQ